MGDNKLAIVTGGSRGIGRAICLRLAKAGFDIVLTYNSGQEAAEETAKLCEESGVKALALKANVADSGACKELVQKAMEFSGGRIDALVNNAGITKDNLIMRMSDEDLDAVLDTNLKGAFYMMREVSRPMMKQKYGRIVNLSSVVGISGNGGQVNYAASKAGIIGMTKSIAKELAKKKVTANAVAPGMIMTDMTGALSDAVKESILTMIPLGEMGLAEDVANTVAFLVSDEARYITGEVIRVDGGMAI